MEPIKVFISYSWDSPEHNAWVKKLADTLEEIEEIHVTWDGYDLDSLVDKNYFMEAGIYDADLLLVVTTAKYNQSRCPEGWCRTRNLHGECRPLGRTASRQEKQAGGNTA